MFKCTKDSDENTLSKKSRGKVPKVCSRAEGLFALGSVSVFAAADHGAEGGGYYTPYLVPCGGSLWYGFEHVGPVLVRKKSP